MARKRHKRGECGLHPRHMVGFCAAMRRKHRPNQRPLSRNDALQKLMRRVLESAAADPDLLRDAATKLIEAKQYAKQAVDALRNATENFIRRMAGMRYTIAWMEEPESDTKPNPLQVATGICEISPERFRQAMYDKIHKQTLDELLRRPGYICSACGHIH